MCREAGVHKTETGDALRIADVGLLTAARHYLCSEVAARYKNFGAVTDGFASSSDKSKATYMRIVQACVEASDAELLAGLPEDTMIERIRAIDSAITAQSVRSGLQRLDQLQSEKSIYPMIATYNNNLRRLTLADRELLFYRKYGNPSWPWERSDE